jgi:hypothetical protein
MQNKKKLLSVVSKNINCRREGSAHDKFFEKVVGKRVIKTVPKAALKGQCYKI